MTLVVKLIENGIIGVTGPLTFDTAKDALLQTKILIGPNQQFKIDLSGVGHCDSAGLAYLTSVLRHAKNQNSTVVYQSLPTQMKDLGRVSELDVILDVNNK